MRFPLPQSGQLLALVIATLATGGSCWAEDTFPPTVPQGSAADTRISLKAPDAPVPFAVAPAVEKSAASEIEKPNSSIPEPAAAALGLLGLGLIVFRRFRA